MLWKTRNNMDSMSENMKDLEYHIPKFFLILAGNGIIEGCLWKECDYDVWDYTKGRDYWLIDSIKESVSKTHTEC